MAGEDAPLTVSALSGRIRGALAALPDPLLVRGEIGQWNRAASGHRYFTLKDASASIDCKMWRSAAGRLRFEPQAGQEVVVTGRADYWPVRGQLSLVCEQIDPVGEGALDLAFRQLVEKLRNEGLFEPSRKKPIPDYPQRIALVTSPQAAGLADVLKVLRRQRHLRLMLYPVPVQGEGAAEKVVAALDHLARRSADVGGIDLVLLVRGGGSREDLWTFNEEIVARAVASLPIPIIVGVGHETDTSIAELAADERAHTPTEAAARAVRLWQTAGDRVAQHGVLLRRSAREALLLASRRVAEARRHEGFRRPLETIDRRRQRVDEQAARLGAALRQLARRTSQRLQTAAAALAAGHPTHQLRLRRHEVTTLRARLASHGPGRQLHEARSDLADAAKRLSRTANADLNARRGKLSALERQLKALDPTAVLRRGYSLTFVKRGRERQLVRSAAEVKAGDQLVTRFGDGEITSLADDPKQGQLFE